MTTVLEDLAACIGERRSLSDIDLARAAVEFLATQTERIVDKHLLIIDEGDDGAFGHMLNLILQERP